jgi:hypothetical protein
MRALQISDVAAEIVAAERELNEPDQRAIRLWERIRIPPRRWRSSQYPGTTPVWVIAVLGCRCMYYNELEGGWGWGRYTDYGTVSEFHWQNDEIHHVVFQTTFALLEGGTG